MEVVSHKFSPIELVVGHIYRISCQADKAIAGRPCVLRGRVDVPWGAPAYEVTILNADWSNGPTWFVRSYLLFKI